MMPSTSQDVRRDGEPAVQPFDVVALLRAWHAMPIGQWGTVIAVFDDATCEVEFTDPEGHAMAVGRVAMGDLELLWGEE